MIQLRDRTAIVTGAGRGIGRAITLAIAAEGANVALTARTESEIEETAAEARKLGVGALAIAGDAADEVAVGTVVDAATAEFGQIDVLINNAGFAIRSPVFLTEIGDWDRVIAVNLRGPFLYSRAVAGQMAERRSGVIIGISSAAGLRGAPVHTMGAYAASKFGLIGFNESLAESLRESGVCVFTICPGPVSDAGGSTRRPAGDPPNPRAIESKDVAKAAIYAITSLPLPSSGRVLDLYQPTF